MDNLELKKHIFTQINDDKVFNPIAEEAFKAVDTDNSNYRDLFAVLFPKWLYFYAISYVFLRRFRCSHRVLLSSSNHSMTHPYEARLVPVVHVSHRKTDIQFCHRYVKWENQEPVLLRIW